MKNILSKLESSNSFWFLFITTFFFFLLRLPSLFEPYWYGDEGIYEVIGYAMRHGRILYSGIWDNKPPLLYLIYALFSGDQFGAKLASLLVGVLSVVVFYFLAKKLLIKRLHVYIATGFFTVLFGIPLLEGNIANAENFMLLPIMAGALLILKVSTKKKLQTTSYILLATSGLLLGIAFLIKIVSIFDLGAFMIFIGFLWLGNFKSIWKILFAWTILGISFVLPLFVTTLYFISLHQLPLFIQSAFTSNVGYVNYGNQIFIPFTHHLLPQGFLLIKLFFLFIFLGLLFLLRKKLSFSHLFICILLAFSLFNALFSQRPYTHYVLVMLPAFCLLIGTIQNKSFTLFSLGIGIILLVILWKNFNFYNKSIGYYANFLSFVTHQKTQDMYQAFFDANTPKDYHVADFINQNKHEGDSVFVFGNSGQIYALTHTLPPGRFIVAYWITSTPQTLTETTMAFKKTVPTFFVIQPGQATVPFSLKAYAKKIQIDDRLIYE